MRHAYLGEPAHGLDLRDPRVDHPVVLTALYLRARLRGARDEAHHDAGGDDGLQPRRHLLERVRLLALKHADVALRGEAVDGRLVEVLLGFLVFRRAPGHSRDREQSTHRGGRPRPSRHSIPPFCRGAYRRPPNRPPPKPPKLPPPHDRLPPKPPRSQPPLPRSQPPVPQPRSAKLLLPANPPPQLDDPQPAPADR